MFEILWMAGDKTWLPYDDISHLTIVLHRPDIATPLPLVALVTRTTITTVLTISSLLVLHAVHRSIVIALATKHLKTLTASPSQTRYLSSQPSSIISVTSVERPDKACRFP